MADVGEMTEKRVLIAEKKKLIKKSTLGLKISQAEISILEHEEQIEALEGQVAKFKKELVDLDK